MSHDPTEHVQEHLQHEATHGGHASKWITAAALTAAFLAAFAAVSGALATTHLTESTLKRIDSNDKWNEYGQKSVKSSNIDTRNFEYKIVKFNATIAPGGAVKLPAEIEASHVNDLAKQKEYKSKEVKDSLPSISDAAHGLEKLSTEHLDSHEMYEGAATMFHIAIAIVAIAVVAKRKEFWYVSIVAGAVGVSLFGYAYVRSPAAEKPEQETTETAAPEHAGAAGKAEHGETGGHSASEKKEHAAPTESGPASGHAPAPEGPAAE